MIEIQSGKYCTLSRPMYMHRFKIETNRKKKGVTLVCLAGSQQARG